MADKISSIQDVFAALPAVQEAVRKEIADRIVAGEFIARVEGDKFVSHSTPRSDLAKRRKKLGKQSAGSADRELVRKTAT